MVDDAKREAVALALFRLIYVGCIDDDPEFPDRLWAELSFENRRQWYRQADTAISVIEKRYPGGPNA